MFSEKEKSLLKALDLNRLPEPEQLKRLNQFYDTLKVRLGLRLENVIEDEQLKTVIKTLDEKGPIAAGDFLKNSIKDYEAIVIEETSKLVADIKADTEKIKSLI